MTVELLIDLLGYWKPGNVAMMLMTLAVKFCSSTFPASSQNVPAILRITRQLRRAHRTYLTEVTLLSVNYLIQILDLNLTYELISDFFDLFSVHKNIPVARKRLMTTPSCSAIALRLSFCTASSVSFNSAQDFPEPPKSDLFRPSLRL